MRTLAVLAVSLFSTQALAGASASSFKKENRRGVNFWNAQNTIDGKMDTAWMVPGESENKGESIEFDVPKIAIDKIGVVVGFTKDEETFADYARVKKAKLEVSYWDGSDLKPSADERIIEFEDKPEMQVVDFEDLLYPGEGGMGDQGGKVKMTILEVYPGRDYTNFAVSEVLLYLSEFDAAPKVSATSNDDEMMGLEMLDDNVKTAWKAPAEGASFEFGAGGMSLSTITLHSADKGYDRPKKIEVTASGRSATYDLKDATTPQSVLVPAVGGYTGSAWGEIEIKILETYPGTRNKGTVAIHELTAKATNSDGL